MGIFSKALGQLTPQYVVESCQISNSFETIFIVVLVTCKNEEVPIKSKKLAASKAYSIHSHNVQIKNPVNLSKTNFFQH